MDRKGVLTAKTCDSSLTSSKTNSLTKSPVYLNNYIIIHAICYSCVSCWLSLFREFQFVGLLFDHFIVRFCAVTAIGQSTCNKNWIQLNWIIIWTKRCRWHEQRGLYSYLCIYVKSNTRYWSLIQLLCFMAFMFLCTCNV